MFNAHLLHYESIQTWSCIFVCGCMYFKKNSMIPSLLPLPLSLPPSLPPSLSLPPFSPPSPSLPPFSPPPPPPPPPQSPQWVGGLAPVETPSPQPPVDSVEKVRTKPNVDPTICPSLVLVTQSSDNVTLHVWSLYPTCSRT